MSLHLSLGSAVRTGQNVLGGARSNERPREGVGPKMSQMRKHNPNRPGTGHHKQSTPFANSILPNPKQPEFTLLRNPKQGTLIMGADKFRVGHAAFYDTKVDNLRFCFAIFEGMFLVSKAFKLIKPTRQNKIHWDFLGVAQRPTCSNTSKSVDVSPSISKTC